MTTTTKTISPNSFSSYISSKTLTSEATCNICKRLLYAFEEILRCRVCYGAYHWRCVKPQRVSRYGQNDNYTCENCAGGTTTNISYQSSNGTNRTKSTDSFDINDRDFGDVILRTNSTETEPKNTDRHDEDNKQQSQTQTTTKRTELDDYLPPQTNADEYHYRNGQYNDDSRTPPRRIQQQQQQQQQGQNGIESDDENDRSATFQANYEYTPLKEYAAMRNNRPTNDNKINSYQNSPPDNFDRQPTSRYGGGLQYTNHGYDPTVTRLVEVPLISPTADSLSTYNRHHNFSSTANINITEKPSRYQQQHNSLDHSTSYSPINRENDSPTFKSLSQLQQQQTDRHSIVGSDSGIVTSSSQQQQPPHVDENHIVEKKLTNLVQELGKQLENDAQKLNDKLEVKLKNLEDMINQQTFVIRRQDEVIESLKTQILQIETERDHFRQRLSVHEQREQIEKKKIITKNDAEKFYKQNAIHEENNQSNMKNSNTSTVNTDNNKSLIKKTPAPRVDNKWSTINGQHEPTVAKLVKNAPTHRERIESDSSSASSISDQLVASIPIVETPPASSRLDNIIHESNKKNMADPSSSSYSLAQIRRQDRPQLRESIYMEQRIVTSVHQDDHDDNNNNNHNNHNDKVFKQKRSNSSSSSSSSSSLPAQPVQKKNTITTTTTAANRNPNKYPSFESLQTSTQIEQNPQLPKTSSLQFGTKPVRNDETGSTYNTPVDSNHPAIQSAGVVKGWLRKQNRESFLKRIERYYCVVRSNTLLMYRHDYDRAAHKTINLKGAKIHYYDDPKFGPSLELIWSNQSSDPKHYHLYAPNPQEADQWLTGIQTAIRNLENKNNWQRYRMNT